MIMRIAEICSSPVFVAYPDQALAVAAREMRAHEVGALVVVAAGDRRQCPLGILTDRDIIRGQVNQSADLHCLAVRDVMTRYPLCIGADVELSEAIAMLASRGVRRAPVIAEELRELADIAAPEPRRRAWRAPETLAGAARV